MSKESSYELLQKKKWRALTYDWETLSSYGNTANLYCLTDFQAAWLLSNTQYMRWPTRWSNCPCTEGDLDAMAADMEYNLMNCFDTRWMGQLNYVYQRANDEQLELFELEYDADGIPGINENTPEDYYTGDESTDRVDALCMACDTYVRSYLNNWLQQASLLIGLVSILGIVVSSTPFIGLIAGVIIGGLAFITQTAVDAVNDSDAVNNVICCMFNGLYGLAVNEANFQASLSFCAFEIGSNEAIIRDIVSSDLNQSKNWYSFLNALGNSWVLLQAGVDFECPCEASNTWEITILIGTSQGMTAYYTVNWGNSATVYVSTVSHGSGESLQLTVDLPAAREISAVIIRDQGDLNGNAEQVKATLFLETVQQAQVTQGVSNTAATNHTLTFADVEADQVVVYAQSGTTHIGARAVSRVTIQGKGSNPYL